MPTHPEQAAHETFVGNVADGRIPSHLGSLKTARLGEVAYDIDGKKLPKSYRPLLIARSESEKYDRIMMDRFNAIRG